MVSGLSDSVNLARLRPAGLSDLVR